MKQRSRTYNSTRNVIIGFTTQILTTVFTFISRTIFIKILGAEYLGINGLFSNILTLLSLAELGIGTAITYSIYKPLKENDERKCSALINFYGKSYSTIAIIVLVIGMILIPLLPQIVHTDAFNMQDITKYYILFLLNTVASYMFAGKSAIILADQKMYLQKLYTFVCHIVMIILQILILVFTRNFTLYLVVQIVMTLATNISISIKAQKMYPYIKNKDKLEKNEKKEIFTNIKSLFLYKVMGVVLYNTDNIIISILIGTMYVGIYSNYVAIINAVNAIIGIVFTSITASIGNLNAGDDVKKKLQIFNVSDRIATWIFGMASIALVVLFNDFVKLWAGSEYVMGFESVIAIVATFYISGILQPIWIYRETTGMFKKTKYVTFFTAIINIVLSIILGNICGVFGILIATFIARITTNFWYEPYVIYKYYFKESSVSYFKKHIYNFVILVFGICITLAVSSLIVVNNVWGFILKSIVVVIMTVIIYYIAYRRSGEYKYLYNQYIIKVLNKLKGKILQK